MNTSQTINKIAPALLKAQAAVANAVKTGTNPHFRNKYAPLEEVIKVCKDALNANGISFIQGGELSDGDLLHLSTRLLHESGEWIESTVSMKPVKADPQGIGSCITYARRYALAAMCGVASEEDDDANAASHAPETKRANGKAPTTNPPATDRKAIYGRIAVQKSRPVAKALTEAQWDGLLCDVFDIPAKELITELSPIALNAGVEKLIETLDAMENKAA